NWSKTVWCFAKSAALAPKCQWRPIARMKAGSKTGGWRFGCIEFWKCCIDWADAIASKLAPTLDQRRAQIVHTPKIQCGSGLDRDESDAVLMPATHHLLGHIFTDLELSDRRA